MKNWQEKLDNNDTSAGFVVAEDFNSAFNELENAVSPMLVLDALQSNQLQKAIDIYAKATHYTDSGTANTVVLSRGATATQVETLFDGMVINFTPKFANTGATTIAVNGLPAKPLKNLGIDLPINFLTTSYRFTAIYDATNEWFECLGKYATLASPAFLGDVSINGVNVGVYPYSNRIINGAMNVNQINGATAVTPTTSAYTSDQWYADISQASKLTFQTVADATSGFKYSTKITVASQYAPLSTDKFNFLQRIEGQNIIDFAFGTADAVTINTSLRIKGSVAGTYSCSIRSSSGDRSYVGTITVGTSWSKVSINLVGANDGTWNTDNTVGLSLSIDLGSGSNYNTTAGVWQNGNFTRTAGSVTFVNQVAGSTLNITGVQLEKVPTGATQGTEYEWLSYDEELRRCQRYYWRTFKGILGYPQYYLYGLSGNTHGVTQNHPVEMRIAPTMAILGAWNMSACTISISGISQYGYRFAMQATATTTMVASANSDDDYIYASAQL